MKTKITRNLPTTILILGAATLFALPLQAGRGSGSGGNAGQCPNGYTPGTRAMEDCTRALDGSGSQYGNKGNRQGQKSGTGSAKRQGARDGSGQGRGTCDGSGSGTGNPEDCPNYGG